MKSLPTTERVQQGGQKSILVVVMILADGRQPHAEPLYFHLRKRSIFPLTPLPTYSWGTRPGGRKHRRYYQTLGVGPPIHRKVMGEALLQKRDVGPFDNRNYIIGKSGVQVVQQNLEIGPFNHKEVRGKYKHCCRIRVQFLLIIERSR